MVWVLAVTETISYAALLSCFAVMLVPMRVELDGHYPRPLTHDVIRDERVARVFRARRQSG